MRRRNKKRIMIGEKIPLAGAITGVAIMKIGVIIARMEGSEYV